MADIKYEVLKEIMVLSAESEKENAFHVEVNLISWNGSKPKLDIRRWDRYRQKMGKGISLSLDDAETILGAAEEIWEAIRGSEH